MKFRWFWNSKRSNIYHARKCNPITNENSRCHEFFCDVVSRRQPFKIDLRFFLTQRLLTKTKSEWKMGFIRLSSLTYPRTNTTSESESANKNPGFGGESPDVFCSLTSPYLHQLLKLLDPFPFSATSAFYSSSMAGGFAVKTCVLVLFQECDVATRWERAVLIFFVTFNTIFFSEVLVKLRKGKKVTVMIWFSALVPTSIPKVCTPLNLRPSSYELPYWVSTLIPMSKWSHPNLAGRYNQEGSMDNESVFQSSWSF